MTMLGLTPSATCTFRGTTRPFVPRTACRARQAIKTPTRAIAEVNLVVGGATFAALALGRFVFLPFHRDNLARQGLPRQNGITHAEAGDRGAEEATFLLKTNDPAGFNIIDVLAWGALGHAAAFYLLATTSLNSAAGPPVPF
ncbi:PSAG1 [Auxenochlorella protothecoides x Auxenochlorella symbiontica]